MKEANIIYFADQPMPLDGYPLAVGGELPLIWISREPLCAFFHKLLRLQLRVEGLDFGWLIAELIQLPLRFCDRKGIQIVAFLLNEPNVFDRLAKGWIPEILAAELPSIIHDFDTVTLGHVIPGAKDD